MVRDKKITRKEYKQASNNEKTKWTNIWDSTGHPQGFLIGAKRSPRV